MHLSKLLLRWHQGKERTCACRRLQRFSFDPWLGKIPWRRKWHSSAVFLHGKFHGQRSLVGYSPWGLKESDMSARLSRCENRDNTMQKMNPNVNQELWVIKNKQNHKQNKLFSHKICTQKVTSPCPHALLLSCVRLFVTPCTVACQAPLSMGIFQAKILEWVAMPSSRGSSQSRDQIQVFCIADGVFTI